LSRKKAPTTKPTKGAKKTSKGFQAGPNAAIAIDPEISSTQKQKLNRGFHRCTRIFKTLLGRRLFGRHPNQPLKALKELNESSISSAFSGAQCLSGFLADTSPVAQTMDYPICKPAWTLFGVAFHL
jgi:hypothetical protein